MRAIRVTYYIILLLLIPLLQEKTVSRTVDSSIKKNFAFAYSLATALSCGRGIRVNVESADCKTKCWIMFFEATEGPNSFTRLH